MHARGRGSDYEKSERMKMDPRDTVKLRASLVVREDSETYRQRKTGDRAGGGKRKERQREMEGGAKDEKDAIEAMSEIECCRMK